jgi:hypothetical protein
MRRIVCLAALIAAAITHANESVTVPCEPLNGSSPTGEIKLPGGDRPIPYEATFTRIAVPDEGGLPQGTIAAVSYRRVGGDTNNRPVVFAFGGGPGAAANRLNSDSTLE